MRRHAIFIHDGKRIIEANDLAAEMFRCDRWQLIDRDLLEFVPEHLRDLTRFNLYTTLGGRGTMLKKRSYDFVRCDGSVFSAEVRSRRCGDYVATSVTYRYEVSKP